MFAHYHDSGERRKTKPVEKRRRKTKKNKKDKGGMNTIVGHTADLVIVEVTDQQRLILVVEQIKLSDATRKFFLFKGAGYTCHCPFTKKKKKKEKNKLVTLMWDRCVESEYLEA